MRAAITTLGCRLNQAESALLGDGLRRHGFDVVPWGDDADLIVINSCAVTGTAEKKTRQALGAARQRWPRAIIVLAGCVATLDDRRWRAVKTANLLVPNRIKTHVDMWLPEALRAGPDTVQPHTLSAAPLLEDDGAFTEEGVGHAEERTRANIKIQEGCDCFCSYCIVPFARGAPRSRRIHDVLREAHAQVRHGCRELVLTGVNIGAYSESGNDLVDVAERVLELNDGFRLRFSSLEPGPIIPRVAELMAANSRVCRFLHMPLQYGEDTMLQRMNRTYTSARYAELAALAKAAVPGLCLGSDLIVGFPGETRHAFDACCQFIDETPFSYLHVFRFSPRTGTAAAALPDRIDARLAGERHRHVTAMAQEKACRFAADSVGATVEVLVEGVTKNNLPLGVSDNFLRVEIQNLPPTTPKNALVTVRLHGVIGMRAVSGLAVDTPGAGFSRIFK